MKGEEITVKIEVEIDSAYVEPKVVIFTEAITEEISDLMKKLTEQNKGIISGFKDEEVKIIDSEKIFRIYAYNQKVYVVTEDGEFSVKLRLYELEERLNKNYFVRISNSEIVNLKKVEKFDLSFSGTICVLLKNKECAYVSRRYVSKIKKVLGI